MPLKKQNLWIIKNIQIIQLKFIIFSLGIIMGKIYIGSSAFRSWNKWKGFRRGRISIGTNKESKKGN